MISTPSFPAVWSQASVREADYDVVIVGGAFSGSAAAMMLKRERPELKIVVVERTSEFKRKVGESTSEVGACFLTRVLRLGHYLSAEHYQKHGLRMWFYNEGQESAETCAEIGPKFQSRLPTFQLDRSKLDQHMIEQIEALGVEVRRPVTLREINLAQSEDAAHVIQLKDEAGMESEISCRWLIDASGKAALLAKKLKLRTALGDEHQTASIWCRFRNVNPLDSYETCQRSPRFLKEVKGLRTTATNHLMGHGWWCWIIPLANGDFSVGVVYDKSIYTPPAAEKVGERLRLHLLQHPVGRLMFESAEPVENDIYYYNGLAYHTEEMTGNRWVMVGDAAGFMDPLYSQGLDFCAHTVYSTAKMLLKDFRNEDFAEHHDYLKYGYKRSYRLWFESLYKGKYHYMGDAELMMIAYVMDLATYFVGPVRSVYDNPEVEFSLLPYNGKAGGLFAKFMTFYNRRLHTLAIKRIKKGIYGKANQEMDGMIRISLSPNFAAPFRFLWWGLRLWAKAEWKTYFSANMKQSMAETTEIKNLVDPKKMMGNESMPMVKSS
jgi:flavin-dependent dehydrogenase